METWFNELENFITYYKLHSPHKSKVVENMVHGEIIDKFIG